MEGWCLWFLKLYLMARKTFRKFGSGGPVITRKAWVIAHEKMGIERNSSFMALKCKISRNGHGGAMTMVPKVVLDDLEIF